MRNTAAPGGAAAYERITPWQQTQARHESFFGDAGLCSGILARALLAAAVAPDRGRWWRSPRSPTARANRGKQMVESAVKQVAVAAGIPVLQPSSLRKDPEAVQALRLLAPDVIVVAAYGLIPPRGAGNSPSVCINVHASVLPAYRGASPITAAILDGLDATGVTIMLMDGAWMGPALRQATQPIAPDDTTATLSERLGAGGAILVETLADWLAGDVAPIDQSVAGEPPACQRIDKEAAASTGRSPRLSSSA